ncbi:MAG: glycosyltransferase family 4 protein [Gemmatimonadota bacterium]|nr:glycosyltransferase family 4 protein [Gemmatimonadota bacterium]
MKVLHVETGRHVYGGGLQVLHLVRGLRDRGHEGLLAVPSDSAVGERGEEWGLPTFRFPFAGDADAFSVARLTAAIRQFAPDLVHLHSRRGADTWGVLSALASGVPAVLTRRVDNPEPGWFARAKAAGVGHVIAISHAIERVLLEAGVPRERLSVVHSAVDVDQWAVPPDRAGTLAEFGLPADGIAAAMVAQLIPRKGHGVLLDALARIRSSGGAIPTVVLFGRGPMKDELMETVGRRALEPWVRFAGFRDDLPRWLSSFDFLVHPALMEGLGVAALQAGAAGRPVVGARAGGIPEIVDDGVTGVLVEPGDAAALAEAISRLSSDAELRDALGAAARDRVRARFSIASMVAGNLDVYRRVLRRPG